MTFDDPSLEKYRAPALDKGLDIIELLASADEGMSQTEIAKALNRSPNEIYRMLDRLVRRAYVRRTGGDRYEITLKLFELAHARPPMHRLISQAMPVLRRFAREAEQACHLVIYDRNVLVVVAQVDSHGYWNVSIRVGSRLSMVNTGSGHVFLAFASPEEREMMLDDALPGRREKLSPSLVTRLDRVREQGFESMPSAQVKGVANLSVPVFGPVGTVIAVVTCPYTERLDKKDAPDIGAVLKLVQAAAEELSQRQVTGSS
jgi:DNA-binding IclR family transcriptional regulator